MNICYILFGFSRKNHTSSIIKEYLSKALPMGSIIDLYWYCPTTIDAADSTKVNQDELYTTLKMAGFRNVEIEWFDYDPEKFYKKAMELGFTNNDSFKMRYPPSRKLSLFHNLSKSIEIAYNSTKAKGTKYELTVVTRYDYIPNVIYNIPTELKEGIYIYRDYYTWGVHSTEDRAFYGTPEYIFKIKDLYSRIHLYFTKVELDSEAILSIFCSDTFNIKNIYKIECMEIPIMICPDELRILAMQEEELYMSKMQPIVGLNRQMGSL